MKLPIILSVLAAGSAQAALFIDLTEEAVSTGTGSQVTVTIAGSINTDAFSTVTGPAAGGVEGNVFISGTLVQFGQRTFPGSERLAPQSSTINWYPGSLFNIPTGVSFGATGYQLERNLSTGQINLSLLEGVRGILSYPGPASTLFANSSLASFGITPAEAAAGPYISTATSNGVTDSVTFTFNGAGIPEPGFAALCLLSCLCLLRRRR